MQKSLWIFLILVIPAFLFGKILETSSLDVQAAYYPGNQEGLGVTGDGSLVPISYSVVSNNVGYDTNRDPGRTIGTTWGGVEAQVIYHHRWKISVLTGEGALFKNNNITFDTYGKLSPVHTDIGASATFSPIALANFFAGGAVETGWSFFGLFNGLGRNLPGTNYTAPLVEPLSGIILKSWFGGTIMFDLGAVLPGNWTHVVIAVNPKIEYAGLIAPGVGIDTAWLKEADKGMNFNGWKYWGTYFIGYQLPAVALLNTIGFLVESEQYIDSHNVNRSPMSNGWGSDFVKWNFSPMIQLELSLKDTLTLLFQFTRDIDYSDTTIANRYFEYRKAEGSYTSFKRIVFAYKHKF